MSCTTATAPLRQARTATLIARDRTEHCPNCGQRCTAGPPALAVCECTDACRDLQYLTL